MIELNYLRDSIIKKLKDGYVYIDGELAEDFIIDNFPLPREEGDVYRFLLPSDSSILFVRKTDRFSASLPKLTDFQFNNLRGVVVINSHKDKRGYDVKTIGAKDEHIIKIADSIVNIVKKTETKFKNEKSL